MEPSIYEFPDIFRRVHMERPGEIEQETGFLLEVWRRHYRRPIRRVLDVACGNSPHGQILVRAGIEAVGVDDSPAMISAGRCESGSLGSMRFYRRKIERFKLLERPFDAAIFMCETFPLLKTNATLMSHLKSIAALLRPGGLYCIDVDRHDGVELVRRRRLWRERKVKFGPVRVDVREFHLRTRMHDSIPRSQSCPHARLDTGALHDAAADGSASSRIRLFQINCKLF
jgi:SAM-dependent methyltransferase